MLWDMKNWFRDWRPGWGAQDLDSALHKLVSTVEPGNVVHLTHREMAALRANQHLTLDKLPWPVAPKTPRPVTIDEMIWSGS